LWSCERLRERRHVKLGVLQNRKPDPPAHGCQQLMEYAVREAKRHNLSAIQLYTNATMTENLAMYAHMGFVIV
jgi:hypothetical protein